jgi:hypothetical protein
MDHDVMRSLEKIMAEQADQPFGDVDLQSGRTLQPFSFAGQQGATNLLTKASRALDDGNLGRAKAFIDRAVKLPYDRHEQAAPAALSAHMELFCLVTDALEGAEPGDERWLDAAVAVMSLSDEAVRFDLRDVLTAIDQDYSLSSRESSRLRSAVAAIPKRAELMDLELGATELGCQVVAILVACRAYRAEQEERSN